MERLSRIIDHAVLNPHATGRDNEEGCRAALEYEVASLCVMPCWVAFCSGFLLGSRVNVGTVIGFPHGSSMTGTKMHEAETALRDGARELDAVVNVSKALSGEWSWVNSEIEALAGLSHSAGAVIKIIFENCYLEREHKIRLCEICSDAGVDFVKTSTGFGSGGATEEDVRLMAESVFGGVRVKASGGIRDLERFLLMRSLGAARIGTSSTAAILDEYRRSAERIE